MKTILLAGAFLLAAGAGVFADPRITVQPSPATNTVSLGVTLGNHVSATTTNGPLSYQWRLNRGGVTNDVPGATTSSLILTNIQVTQAGGYTARVSDASGSVESLPWAVQVDPSFIKITTGPVVTGTGATGGAWGDFNNDGFIDLFVSVGNGATSLLYTNNAQGGFGRASSSGIGGGTGSSWASAWGDYDNDGFLDLIGSVYGGVNYTFHNNGNGTFTKLAGDPTVAVGTANNAVWADYDHDGYLDLFCAGGQNYLFHNNGHGGFTKVTNSAVLKDASGQGAAWGDYDNDGFPDLFIARVNVPNVLYHNNGDGTWTKMTNAPFARDISVSQGCSWGDYDNDGRLDLFVCNNNARNFLYHNDGAGAFSKITTGAITAVVAASSGSAWADYDNDGFLDLFVAVRGGVNLLYHNNGDGSFNRVTTGSIVNENGTWIGAAWGDYDNDGFPDLFIGNQQGANSLYRNAGNSNNWITVTCQGRLSNRAAIGAKVRVKATIHGREMWQLREISGGGGLASQNDLRAQFGLGDATNIDLLRVEWPSGLVQEFDNVAPRQFLVIREPSRLEAGAVPGTGAFQLTLTAWPGSSYALESSTNLSTWKPVATLTNETGGVTWTNPPPAEDSALYFRAKEL